MKSYFDALPGRAAPIHINLGKSRCVDCLAIHCVELVLACGAALALNIVGVVQVHPEVPVNWKKVRNLLSLFNSKNLI